MIFLNIIFPQLWANLTDPSLSPLSVQVFEMVMILSKMSISAYLFFLFQNYKLLDLFVTNSCQ